MPKHPYGRKLPAFIHAHNYTVNPHHVWLQIVQTSITKTSVKTRMSSHVCVYVCDDCERKEFNTVNWQSRLHKPLATVSQWWCQTFPVLPPIATCFPCIRYHGNQGAAHPRGNRCFSRHLCSSITQQGINTAFPECFHPRFIVEITIKKKKDSKAHQEDRNHW